ncbi:MAG TPA: ABC transporter permease [Gaiellaceae bacterium]|jgi:peptide/nickel transport system permease protein
MARYVLRRLLLAVSVVAAVSFAAFVGFGLSLDPSFPLAFQPRDRAVVQAYYHLRDPILSRYAHWVAGLVHHGFGLTVSTDVGGAPLRLQSLGEPIGPQLLHAAEVTAALVALALVFVAVGSTAVGVFTAQRRRFHSDVGVRSLAYLGAAVPTFLLGDLLLRAYAPHVTATFVRGKGYVLTTTTGWFLLGPPTGGVLDWLRHLFLPSLTLAIGLIGIYARYLRSAMTVELARPYVMVARGKGLSERRVLLRHVLRNSLVPVASILTLELGGIIGASIAADGIFDSGGLASVFLGALGHADPFQLTAIVVVSAVVVCGFTLAGDLFVGVLDPRVATRSSPG